MKDQIVTYKIAVLLKELGFNNECFSVYGKNERLVYKVQLDLDIEMVKDSITDNFNQYKGTFFQISAPIYQQVTDWIYDNYKLIISIDKKDEKTINMGRWEVREYNILEALKYIKRDLFQRDL